MGHYDSYYEHDAQTALEKRKVEIEESMTFQMGDMFIDDLEFLLKVATNIEEYQTFFKVIKRHTK
jgi:hypothetical protein